MTVVKPGVWAVTTGEAGMVAQAEGLARAFGEPFDSRTIRPRAPWSRLPARAAPGLLRHGLGGTLAPPWPDLLITCGRCAAAVSVAIRRASRRRTFTVHVQDPRIPPRHFDLVAAPRHDGLKGPNVLPTRGALHGVTPERLAAAGTRWRGRLGALRVAVLLGGASRACRFTPASADALAQRLARLEGPLAVTPSRRTGAGVVAALRTRLPRAWFWDGAGDNPYLGMLALARHIVVTEDSVSMISEAAATGKPVYLAAMAGGGRRLARFHAMLRDEGVTRPFDGTLAEWTYAPIDDTARVAEEIRRRMGARAGRAP